MVIDYTILYNWCDNVRIIHGRHEVVCDARVMTVRHASQRVAPRVTLGNEQSQAVINALRRISYLTNVVQCFGIAFFYIFCLIRFK